MRAPSPIRLGLVAALALAGCAIGPNYKRPDTATPPAFKGLGDVGSSSVADQDWTDIYTDPRLQELIKAALANGFDARIAAARVGEYRAMAAQTHGMLFPTVGYEANADRGRNAQLGNAYTQGGGATADGFDGYLGAAWEFDLWGRVRRLDEAARSQYLASEEARRGVLLSLVSDVATAYYELLELDEELAIAGHTQTAFASSLTLFRRQLEGGVVSRLDTEAAEAALAASKARIPDIRRQISVKETEISLLIGANPGPIVRGAKLSDQEVPTDVPTGLPSALLERRPDVREAEEAARAANAGVGVTLGGFLPRIGLSAILGGVSNDLSNITSRKAGLWSVGASASGPLFQGGGLRGQYDEAKEAWEIAKLQYQQTALAAFGDVANALVNRKELLEIRVQQEAAVKAYEETVTLSTERYKAGKASYYEVLQSEEALYPAEIALAQTRKDQFTAVVQLYKALGGGWKSADLSPKE